MLWLLRPAGRIGPCRRSNPGLLRQVQSGRGNGGAIYCNAGDLRLEGCLLYGNRALMASTTLAFAVTAGAIAVGANARVALHGSRLWSNEAGGVGLYESFGVSTA